MKLSYLALSGFRGYRKPLRLDFADGFTIIDGRNGVGKSTVFDAVEFVLTGTIAKYSGAKADGETVADYIWWSGEGPPPDEHYVEVGFEDEGELFTVRRTQISDNPVLELDSLLSRLCDAATMPSMALPQLCSASILRDEHIAALSLDLKETERYALLCDALGATDADLWTSRGAKVLAQAKKRVAAAEAECVKAAEELSSATRRVDEVRALIVEEGIVASAVARLQAFVGRSAAPDQIAEVARTTVAERTRQRDLLVQLRQASVDARAAANSLQSLRSNMLAAERAYAAAVAELSRLESLPRPDISAGELGTRARDLAALAMVGRRLGFRDDRCQLCTSRITSAEFERGIETAEALARELDSQAALQVQQEEIRSAAEASAALAEQVQQQHRTVVSEAERILAEYRVLLNAAGFTEEVETALLEEREGTLGLQIDAALEDLRVVETLQLNIALERATHAEVESREAYARAEERLGVARRGEHRAQSLHDAARRAAGETLNQRLERVLPLMAELYRRLRPHPIWGDLEYKIRGDVRRFLKLQVGDELNPQFMFSSGQRRATGLAFLLSVNLSLSWSRWRTILLDDPVQHVDDFRSVHLTEVLAQLCAAGRQLVCSVEDEALADLLCRRLPVDSTTRGRRITLGVDQDGALGKLRDEQLAPLVYESLVPTSQLLAG